MNRLTGFLLALLVGFFVAAWAIAYNHFDSVDHQLEKKLNLEQIRHDYYERVGWLRSNPDDKAYRQEVNTFFRWYFQEVDRYVKRWHENPEFTDYLNEVEKSSGQEVKANRRTGFGQELGQAIDKKAAAVTERKAFFTLEKKAFDGFRSGHYQPVFTATDKGMRLDVASDDVTIVNGKPKVRISVVLWGPTREIIEAEGIKRVRTDVSFSSSWKLFDAKNKLYGEVSVGNLAMRNDFPERLIPVFPPQMVLGHYDMDLVPSNVDHLEITFSVTSHSPSGGTADASYSWKIPTPPEWKLRPGEAWEGATEQVRSEEEIDPSKAKKEARN